MRRALMLLALIAVAPAAARGEAELALVLGHRGGQGSFLVEADADVSCLLPPCVEAEADVPEGESLGLILDVEVAPGWALEALLDRQEGDLGLTARAVPGRPKPESFELTTLQIGAMRRWGADRLQPFVAAGVGVTRAETSAAVLEQPVRPGDSGRRVGASDVLSLGLGGGGRLALDARWGLRFEARGYWIDLPRRLGGELVQLEIGVGLSARL